MMHKTTDNIQFHYLKKGFPFTQRAACKQFIRGIFRKEKTPLDALTYIFCSDDYLLEINRTHLNHDYYTDIITFELSDPGSPTTGEIYISVDRVKENAGDHGQSFARELHRVIFHGVLHLCGYGDKTAREEKIMRDKEDFYLNKYFSEG